MSHICKERIEEAIAERQAAVRSDMIQAVMRDAVLESSLHLYNGRLYVFTGLIYEPGAWSILRNVVYDVMRRCGVPLGNYSRSRVRSISDTLRDAVERKPLVVDPSLMVFSNVVYNTMTREVCCPSPGLVAVSRVDYPYDAEEIPMRWYRFLDRVLPDKHYQRALQEFLGAVFIRRDRVKIEHMMILLGGGANGKSVVFETVRGILGKENVKTFGIGSLIGGGESLKNIATINGCRLNYCSEINARDLRSNIDTLKVLISGEKMQARFLNENPFDANDIPLLMANANQMPPLGDSSEAIARRLIIIPFEEYISPSERDPELAEKMRKDYPGIFNWVMQGMESFISNGYKMSGLEKIRENTEEYRQENSTAIRYMRQRRMSAQPGGVYEQPIMIKASDLYEDYRLWCLDEMVDQADVYNRTTFGLALKSANYRKKQTSDGMMYYIYGDRDKIKVRFEGEAGDDARKPKWETRQDTRPFTENGRIWVRTRGGISAVLGCGERVLQTLKANNLLSDCYRKDSKDPRVWVYDLELTRKAVMQYLENKKTSEADKEERKRLSTKRMHFNTRCKKLGLPFRKYDTKGDLYFMWNNDGLVLVPDDWSLGESIPDDLMPKKTRKNLEKLIMLENYEKFKKGEIKEDGE